MYLTTPQTTSGAYPLGGHYLLTIAPAGDIVSVRKFTNSCVNLGPPPGRGGRHGTPVGMFVTHLLDPLPTEIHVFTSLSAKQPVFVGIGNPPRVWMVTGDGIGQLPMPAEPERRRRN
jgi:hypothetical protein